MKPKYKNIDQIHREYSEKKETIEQSLREYSAVPEENYFYELLYCLMTPQSSAMNSSAVQQHLMKLDYQHRNLNIEEILRSPAHYIRFHKTKARYIEEMKSSYPVIQNILCSPSSAVEKREWLVVHVKGMSDKEATHFLRNIGMSDHLVILDRHILRNLNFHGVIDSIPPSLSRKQYREIEQKVQHFADEIAIPVAAMDLLFWSRETGFILK